MSDDKKDAVQTAGCGVMLWQLFVTTPMWLVLLFGLLRSADAETYLWVLYWCYVPACVLGGIISGLYNLLKVGLQ